MKKSVWIFLLAVFLPGAVLGWLALRGVEEQQIIFERRTAELYQKETDALATSVREAVEAQRREFSDVVRQLLAQGDAQALALDFNNTLADAWPHKAVGFAISTNGTMLSPNNKAAENDAGLREFIRSNGDWLCNTQLASVYRVPIDNTNNRLVWGSNRKGGQFEQQQAGVARDNLATDREKELADRSQNEGAAKAEITNANSLSFAQRGGRGTNLSQQKSPPSDNSPSSQPEKNIDANAFPDRYVGAGGKNDHSADDQGLAKEPAATQNNEESRGGAVSSSIDKTNEPRASVDDSDGKAPKFAAAEKLKASGSIARLQSESGGTQNRAVGEQGPFDLRTPDLEEKEAFRDKIRRESQKPLVERIFGDAIFRKPLEKDQAEHLPAARAPAEDFPDAKSVASARPAQPPAEVPPPATPPTMALEAITKPVPASGEQPVSPVEGKPPAPAIPRATPTVPSGPTAPAQPVLEETLNQAPAPAPVASVGQAKGIEATKPSASLNLDNADKAKLSDISGSGQVGFFSETVPLKPASTPGEPPALGGTRTSSANRAPGGLSGGRPEAPAAFPDEQSAPEDPSIETRDGKVSSDDLRKLELSKKEVTKGRAILGSVNGILGGSLTNGGELEKAKTVEERKRVDAAGRLGEPQDGKKAASATGFDDAYAFSIENRASSQALTHHGVENDRRNKQESSDANGMTGGQAPETKALQAQAEQLPQFAQQQGKLASSSGGNNFTSRQVAPTQLLNAPSQAVSSLTPATTDFHMITSVSYEGMVSRFVQDKLDLILWLRPPEAPELVFGCLIEASSLKELWPALVGSMTGDNSGGQPPFLLALLDDKAKPMDGQPMEGRDWKRPFVATEIGEVLPHWEAALYLASPNALAESARGLRRTLSFTVAAALALILIGAWLVVTDIRRQLALAQQKTDFVSNVSHELKTPLTSIRMFAELMHDRPPPAEKQGQYLRIITVEAERLTRLINNVLDFAKLERKQKRFEKRPIDLHCLIARVWEGHEMHLRDAGFTTRWEAAPGPYPVIGDEDALAQIIVNLLSNAEKYSLECKEVELHSWSEDRWLYLSVLDRGMGVPDGEERKIFESFYRAHDSLSSGIQGSGLGLTLAQRLAEEHGGKIEFARRDGGGCRFTLRLPLASGEAGPGPRDADSELRGQSADFPSASPLPPV